MHSIALKFCTYLTMLRPPTQDGSALLLTTCSGAQNRHRGGVKARWLPNRLTFWSWHQIAHIFSTPAFSLWFNYWLTQVHLLWSFLNVRASNLKCEPSIGLCNSPRLMRTANKRRLNAPRWQAAVHTPASWLQRSPRVLWEGGTDAPWGSGIYACMNTHTHTHSHTSFP